MPRHIQKQEENAKFSKFLKFLLINYENIFKTQKRRGTPRLNDYLCTIRPNWLDRFRLILTRLIFDRADHERYI